jgi:hypothetical protein
MQSCALTQRQPLARGTNNHIFTENGSEYCCIGAQPGRAERGVQSGLYAEIKISKQGMGFYSQGSEARRVCIRQVHGHRHHLTHLMCKAPG